MRTFRLTLEYDGSKFSGWQAQINARSVQGDLQRVADELFGVEVDLQGAGRTDAGVHAVGQVAHIKVRKLRDDLPPVRILRELNDRLPSSIAVLECVETAPGVSRPSRRRLARLLLPDLHAQDRAFQTLRVVDQAALGRRQHAGRRRADRRAATTSSASARLTRRVPANPPR